MSSSRVASCKSAKSRENASALAAQIEKGAKLKGTITSVREFGAFVDLGGIEGLIPKSEIAHERTMNVADVLKAGRIRRSRGPRHQGDRRPAHATQNHALVEGAPRRSGAPARSQKQGRRRRGRHGEGRKNRDVRSLRAARRNPRSRRSRPHPEHRNGPPARRRFAQGLSRRHRGHRKNL